MNNDKTDSVEVGKTWEKLFSLVKRITGDVKVSSQGTLQGQIDATNTKVDECFQNVSDGKTLVANAISDKGVATDADAKFATMATNISKIKTNPALQAKTVTLDTSKTSATLAPDAGYDGLSQVKASITPQTKSVNLSTSEQVVKPDSEKVLSQVTVPAVTGTAALKDVVAGKTFNSASAGIAKTGTLPDKRGTTVDAAAVEQDDDYTYFTVPTEAVYDAKSKIRTMSSNLGNKEVVYAKTNGSYISDTDEDLIVVSSTGGLWNADYQPSITGGTLTKLFYLNNYHDTWSCNTHVFKWKNSKGNTITFSKPISTDAYPVTMTIIK